MDMEKNSRIGEPIPAGNAREVFGKAFPKHVTLIEVGPRAGSFFGKQFPGKLYRH
jgi:hypothetical protein